MKKHSFCNLKFNKENPSITDHVELFAGVHTSKIPDSLEIEIYLCSAFNTVALNAFSLVLLIFPSLRNFRVRFTEKLWRELRH